MKDWVIVILLGIIAVLCINTDSNVLNTKEVLKYNIEVANEQNKEIIRILNQDYELCNIIK